VALVDAYRHAEAPETVPPYLLCLLRFRMLTLMRADSAGTASELGLDLADAKRILRGEYGDFDEGTALALRWADCSVRDHYAVDDALIQGLRRTYRDAQLVEMGWAIMSFNVIDRLAAAFRLPPP
jgi:alkylhydroperoxidase family enzyme